MSRQTQCYPSSTQKQLLKKVGKQTKRWREEKARRTELRCVTHPWMCAPTAHDECEYCVLQERTTETSLNSKKKKKN